MIRTKDDGKPLSADSDWPSFDVSESQSVNMSGGNKKSDRGPSSRSSRSSREAKGEGRKASPAYERGIPADIASESESGGLPASRTDGEESSVCDISFSLRTKQNTERNGKTLNITVPGRRLQQEPPPQKKSKERKARYKEDFEDSSLPLAREKYSKKRSGKHASETEESEAKPTKKDPSSSAKLVLMVEPRETSSELEPRPVKSMSSLADLPHALAGLRRSKDKTNRRRQQVPKERLRRQRSNEYVFSDDKCSHCGAGTEISGDITGRLPTCPYCLEELGLIRDGAPGLSRTLRIGNASYEALIDPGGLLMPGYSPNDCVTDVSESGQYYELPNKVLLPSVPSPRSPPRDANIDRHCGCERWPTKSPQHHQPMCRTPRLYSPRRTALPPEQQVMPEHLMMSRTSPERRRMEGGARSRSPARMSGGGGSPVNRFPGRYQGTASHRRVEPADSDSCLLGETRDHPWAPPGYGPPLCYKRRQESGGHRSPTSRRPSPQRGHV